MKELFQQALVDFAPILQSNSYKRGTLLHQENTLSFNLYLVQSGVLRSFYYVDGRDVTAHFALEYGMIGAADSIIREKKSRYNIEVLENCQVSVLDYQELESFLYQNPGLERLARKLTQMIYMDLVERMEGMTFLSARDRYEHLTVRYPGITQRVSLGHIASFLGITPETLSRIRGQS